MENVLKICFTENPKKVDKSDYDTVIDISHLDICDKSILAYDDFSMKADIYMQMLLLELCKSIYFQGYSMDLIICDDEFEVSGITDIERITPDEFESFMFDVTEEMNDPHYTYIKFMLRDEKHNMYPIAIYKYLPQDEYFMFDVSMVSKIINKELD